MRAAQQQAQCMHLSGLLEIKLPKVSQSAQISRHQCTIVSTHTYTPANCTPTNGCSMALPIIHTRAQFSQIQQTLIWCTQVSFDVQAPSMKQRPTANSITHSSSQPRIHAAHKRTHPRWLGTETLAVTCVRPHLRCTCTPQDINTPLRLGAHILCSTQACPCKATQNSAVLHNVMHVVQKRCTAAPIMASSSCEEDTDAVVALYNPYIARWWLLSHLYCLLKTPRHTASTYAAPLTNSTGATTLCLQHESCWVPQQQSVATLLTTTQ